MNSIESQFVSYEHAVKLKELGMICPALGHYFNDRFGNVIFENIGEAEFSCEHRVDGTEVVAALWVQAFDWFRVEHGLNSWVFKSNTWHYKIEVEGSKMAWFDDYGIGERVVHNTYESARLACL